MQIPLPRTIISLSKAEVEPPKLSSPDPVLVILDRNTSKLFCCVEATLHLGSKSCRLKIWIVIRPHVEQYVTSDFAVCIKIVGLLVVYCSVTSLSSIFWICYNRIKVQTFSRGRG